MKKLMSILFGLFCSYSVLADTLMLEVSVKDGQHTIERSWTVAGDFSMPQVSEKQSALKVVLWNHDKPLESYRIDYPKAMQSPLLNEGPNAEHKQVAITNTIYHVRLPAIAGATHITIDEELLGADVGVRSLQKKPSTMPVKIYYSLSQ